VFIYVIAMHMMQVPVMQVINVASVVNGSMAAIGSMNVWVVGMLRIWASCHDRLLPVCLCCFNSTTNRLCRHIQRRSARVDQRELRWQFQTDASKVAVRFCVTSDV
jgi:hypothetical protein